MKNIFLILFFLLGYTFQVFSQVTFHQQINFGSAVKFKNSTVGGLSSLSFYDDKLFAISDDKGTSDEKGSRNPPRVYQFKMTVEKQKFSFTLDDVQILVDAKKENFINKGFDPEAIAHLDNGDFIVSSEGLLFRKPYFMPRLMIFNKNAELASDIKIPDLFLPNFDNLSEKGFRENYAFESLTMCPDKSCFYVANETPLNQDDEIYDFNRTAKIRILKYEKSKSGEYLPSKAIVYELDKLTPKIPGKADFKGGVSDILLKDENTLIVLERSFALYPTLLSSFIKMYEINFNSAEDSLNVFSLKKNPVKPVEKKLLADFDEFKDKILPDMFFDNFEGMAWGPNLDKDRSIILVSDDNFNVFQKTLFLILRYKN